MNHDRFRNLMLTLFLVAATAAIATAQTTVFVPATASGYFGNPVTTIQPLVQALTVTGPGTIQITYVSGTVNFGAGTSGPGGVIWPMPGLQSPLQEAKGVAQGQVNNMAALMGVFVPQATVNKPGFQPIDGTKNVTVAGIIPSTLFFVGRSKTLQVTGPGTLYLGINDEGIDDNSGGFTVEVTGP